MSSTWADLFDRAADREASLPEIRDALERARASGATDGDRASEADDA